MIDFRCAERRECLLDWDVEHLARRKEAGMRAASPKVVGMPFSYECVTYSQSQPGGHNLRNPLSERAPQNISLCVC